MNRIIPFVIATIFTINASAQGCSDAGICTLGALKQTNLKTQSDSVFRRFSIGLNHAMGIGEVSTNVHISSLTARVFLTKNTQVQVNMPLQIASGKLGTVAGLGDLTIGFSQVLTQNKDWKYTLQLGARIPTNAANISTPATLRPEFQNINKQINTLIKDLINTPIPLQFDLLENDIDITYPMVYQSSRGTYDFMGGLSVEYKTWQLALGYQVPINANNENDVDNNKYVDSVKLPGNLPLPVSFDLSYNYIYGLEAYNEYFSSRKLNRKADFMYRIQKSFAVGNSTKIQVGLLGIYHMGNDVISSPKIPDIPLLNTAKLLLPANIKSQIDNLFGGIEREIEVAGSKGTTLNITAGLQHQFAKRFQFNFDLGFPIVTRSAQPDGLKRSFVGSVGIECGF